VEAILNLKAPSSLKQLKSLLGMMQYYRDMWPKRSHILAPLTAASSSKNKKTFKWTDAMENAFCEMKKIMAQEALLALPDYSKPFQVFTDASGYQLGAVLQQEGKPLAYYTRKLTDTPRRYTTEERELLSIVETLKEFKGMIWGYNTQVYTDHLNLVHETTVKASDRVMRWILLLEEFGNQTIHIKGERNVVSDTLSRLDIQTLKDNKTKEVNCLELMLAEQDEECPLALEVIYQHQKDCRDTRMLRLEEGFYKKT
jgi:hypothetical protein